MIIACKPKKRINIITKIQVEITFLSTKLAKIETL